ncbi:helicase-associated domain-containing protein [Nakamurella lactea]|uniref:helicase-associated domain-containing protein n=1 Tax=Nakamurella lactea TaxID=459515 RepID=UPI000401C4C2|nr:helicase-associated domain-containing protein [Nakamurella lactea]
MPPAPSILAWLRSRDDEQLTALLRARPDLAVPAPSDLSVLARRLDNPTSVFRALEGLTAFSVTVLAALLVARAPFAPVHRTKVGELMGPDADPAATDAALDALELLGLVRSDDDGALTAPMQLQDALGPYPAGLGPATGLDPEAVAAALAAIDQQQRGVLEILDRSSPRGYCPPTAPAAVPVSKLVTAGLLIRVDASTVELPMEVGLALRGDRPMGVIPSPPPLPTKPADPRRIDGTAAGQGLAAVQLMNRLVTELGGSPAPALKAGGIGIREVRRLAKLFGIEEHRIALGLELLAAAGIITSDETRTGRGTGWQPTVAADEFAAAADEVAWLQLAELWLDLRRDPSRVGQRDEAARTLNVLSPELSWLRGPGDRRFVLAALADLPAGTGVGGDQLAAYLAWRGPMRAAERRAALQESTMTEGTWLGLVAFDGITTAARALLAGDSDAAQAAMADALPEPVDQVLVQADLTVVAPGRLDPALAARLEQVAVVESSGTATVYRVTPQSVRAALDTGHAAADLHELFARHSATEVPQALSYLIDDTARRHGVLRIGEAGTYLRSDDPAALADAVSAAQAAGFTLRLIAPTVAISVVSPTDLVEALGDNGIALTAEDAGGSVVALTPRRRRTGRPLVTHQRWREPPVPSEQQLRSLAERMREADGAAVRAGGSRQSATEAMSTLRTAAADHRSVWIGYVDSEGSTSRRVIEPVVVAGGQVVAFDRLRGSMRSFALHRITDARIDPQIPPSEHTGLAAGDPLTTVADED